MDNAFFGANPSKLGVGDEVPPGEAEVGDEGGECAVHDAVGDVVNGGADEVVAATDGEGLGGGFRGG